MSYYNRKAGPWLDGTPIIFVPEDEQAQQAVAAIVSRAWQCEFHSFGWLAPIDWYATRHGRMIGLAEVKVRTHTKDTYPTVFLNLRKWVSLMMGSLGCGVPSVFIVRFTDGIFWTPLWSAIGHQRVRIGGCQTIVKSRNDIEPIVELPVSDLKAVADHPDDGTLD